MTEMESTESDVGGDEISYDHEKFMNQTRTHIPLHILYNIYLFNGILVLIGVIGNILVCTVITRCKKMYTVPNIFLMNLSIADLCILLLCYPLWIISNLLPHRWPFGGFLCKTLFPLTDVFFGVSVGCMMCISVHRYRKIVNSKSRQMSFVHAKCLIIFMYVVSMLTISVPVYPIMQYETGSLGTNLSLLSNNNITTLKRVVYKKCSWRYPSVVYKNSYMLYLIIAWYVIPLLVILCTYLRIKFYLLRRYKWMTDSTRGRGVKPHVQVCTNIL